MLGLLYVAMSQLEPKRPTDIDGAYAVPTALDPVDSRDSIDLYTATLPTPMVRAAGLATMLTGIGFVLMGLQTLATLEGSVPGVLLGVAICATAVGMFVTSWGVTRGRLLVLFLGLGNGLVGGVLALAAMLTVSLIGLVAGVGDAVSLALLVISVPAVRHASDARRKLAKME